MATKSRVKSPLSAMIATIVNSGGIYKPSQSNLSNYVQSINNPSSVTAGVPIVFTVTLKATTTEIIKLMYNSFGSALGDWDYLWGATFSNGVIQQGSQLHIPAGVNSFTITYTTQDKGPFNGSKSLYTMVDFAFGNGSITTAAPVWYPLPLATGMVLPSDFVGMHGSNSFSHAAYSNLATCKFQNFRTHDHGTPGLPAGQAHTLFWYEIERSLGVYDWTELDTVINTMYARGVGVTFTLYGTPEFHAISPPSLIWQPNHTYTAVTHAGYAKGNGHQDVEFVKYVHPTTLNQRRWAPVVTGFGGDSGLTTGATEPTWPSIAASEFYNAAATKAWSGGVLTVTWTAHPFNTGDVVEVHEFGATPYEGFRELTKTGANTFTFPLASDPGSPATFPGLYVFKTFMDGTCRFAPARLALDLYWLNAGAYPASTSAISTFTTAVMSRYNSGGVRKITKFEFWNEPDLAQAGDMYFSGSPSQLVDMGWAARLASKAVDSGTNNIPVIGCGFTFNSSAGTSDPVIFETYLNATGNVYPAIKGVDTLVDGFSWHTYGATSDAKGGTPIDATAGSGNGNILTNGINGGWFINNLRAKIVAAGGSASMPMHLSEWGLFADGASVNSINNVMTAAARKEYMLNWLLFWACTGQKSANIYDYFGNFGGQYNSDTVDNTSGVRGALNEYDTFFKGKTVQSAYYSNTHAVKLTISGTDYVFNANQLGVPY